MNTQPPPGPPDPPHLAWDGYHSCPTCRARCHVLPDDDAPVPYSAVEFCSTSRATVDLRRVRATIEQRDLMRRVLKSVLPYLHTGTVFGNITEARYSVEIALGMREP